MSRRLEFLQKLTASEKGDAFAWYGLAMEYRSLSRFEESVATFEQLRERAPDYVPAYLMCGQVLESLGRVQDARAWFAAGMDAARIKGDAHALSELAGALQLLG